jgi:exodeoxyribonuclease VII large subunit
VTRRRDRFEHLQQALLHNDPNGRVDTLRQRIALLVSQAEHLFVLRLDGIRQEFGDNAARLEVLSPLKTLARGYAVTTRSSDGTVVTDAGALAIDDQLLVQLYRGRICCRVASLETGKA